MFEETEVDSRLAHSEWLGATQQQDADDCVDILKAEKLDWLIVDHYALDEQWQKRLKPYYEKLMVIDDLADRKHQCDILLDQTFGRQQEDYSTFTPKDCKLLLGSQYALLRPEFAKWRSYSLKRRKKSKINQILINVGGVDFENFTEFFLNALNGTSQMNSKHVIVIMGPKSPHINRIKVLSENLSFKVEVLVDVGNMAEILANTDLVFGALGISTWERCLLGVPSVVISTAKNQEFTAKILHDLGAISFLGKSSLVKAKDVESIINMYEDDSGLLLNFSRKSMKIMKDWNIKHLVGNFF
jgi:UDP-2,4-diacetamido-2,4,6-trideoxy-beta-L-altropyranose hydrolase